MTGALPATPLDALVPLRAPLLAVRTADLAGARRITYRLEQAFRYDYDEPVTDLRHRLVVVPPAVHGDVRRRHHEVAVTGAPAVVREERDDAGNAVVVVEAGRVRGHVAFSLVAVLERECADDGGGAGDPIAGAHPLAAAALDDPRHRLATRLTEPDGALRALAHRLRPAPGEAPLVTADRVCEAVHAALSYEHGATGYRTTAAQALAGGSGVCQDSAHVMLAVCRLLGLPARYASGHLLGQGGTHAWVEVLVADPHGGGALAVGLDPCNARRAGRGHLVVATGRDYADVPPTSGSYEGPPCGRLSSTRSLGVVDVVPALAPAAGAPAAAVPAPPHQRSAPPLGAEAVPA